MVVGGHGFVGAAVTAMVTGLEAEGAAALFL